MESIKSLDSLNTECDGTADVMLLIWRLGRIVAADNGLPSFSAFCVRLLPYNEASKIGYLPLIPDSPTNPAVFNEEMIRLIKTSRALGERWTAITGEQATYELALTLRDKISRRVCKSNLASWRISPGPLAKLQGMQE